METDIEELVKVFAQIDDVQTMRRFFDEIFTEAERKDISLRWQLMSMLKRNIPQREIASRLGISLCKITRGAKILKESRSISREMLEKD